MKSILAITFMDLKQEWLTILQKVGEEYQRANSPFMSLIALKEKIDN